MYTAVILVPCRPVGPMVWPIPAGSTGSGQSAHNWVLSRHTNVIVLAILIVVTLEQ